MFKVLDDVRQKYNGKLWVEKIDITVSEANREMAKKYNVRYVPHLLFVDKNGNVIKEEVGFIPPDDIINVFKDKGIALDL